MAMARYKDLCIDASNVRPLGEFWATVLGLGYLEHEDGDAHLTGPTPQHTVWVNRVPEPKAVKHRVHFDVHTESVRDLEALGARVVDHATDRPWVVMADPEGGEFCAFVRSERHDYRLYEVVVDTANPEGIGRWWAEVFGATLGAEEQKRWWWIEDVPGQPFEYMVFARVPEPKRVKNRIHWDVDTDDVDALVAHGATVLRPKGDEGLRWDVLADPDGNEFCAFTP
jgi:hypothetical protein